MDLTARISSQTYALSKLISVRLLFVPFNDDNDDESIGTSCLVVVVEHDWFTANLESRASISNISSKINKRKKMN